MQYVSMEQLHRLVRARRRPYEVVAMRDAGEMAVVGMVSREGPRDWLAVAAVDGLRGNGLVTSQSTMTRRGAVKWAELLTNGLAAYVKP